MLENKALTGLRGKPISQIASLILSRLARERYLWLILLPVLAYFVIFSYIPMYGVTIAFKKFNPALGILGSPWTGFSYFKEFFDSVYCWRLIKNILLLNVYGIIFGFPLPIIFAVLLNEIRGRYLRKTIQTVSYLPHFISTVVVVGILVNFLSPSEGIINTIISGLGGTPVNFMSKPEWFRTIYIVSNIWQNLGWDSIIYLAAITSIDVELYEAIYMDGAKKIDAVLHVTIPGIAPTIIILLILNCGSLLSTSYEKIILMYNPLTYETADVISTYVYRTGILNSQYSFATAVGFFNSVVNFILLVTVNKISRKASDISLW